MAIRKLLVANRGEIALRVFRACRELGIATVAVVAPDDPARCTRAAPTRRSRSASYLDAAEHVRAARESGADAIHPGYGFLAENADFAEAVEAAGLALGRPAAGRAARRRRQAGGEADRGARRACRSCPRARPRSSASRCSSRPRPAAAGAACASSARPDELDEALEAARARGGRRRSATTRSTSSATSSGRGTSRSSCSRTRTARSSRSASASARSSGATRRCSRSRPPPRSTRRSARA